MSCSCCGDPGIDADNINFPVTHSYSSVTHSYSSSLECSGCGEKVGSFLSAHSLVECLNNIIKANKQLEERVKKLEEKLNESS